MIIIDGSYGEGGGQILRYAASLAAAYGKQIKVVNIRAKRPNPGLRPQHIGGLKILLEICGGKVEGLRVGSKEVTLNFGNPKPGEYFYDVGTAGSITLVLQSILPVLALHSGYYEITIIGGTDVKWSPTSDYLKYVLLPNLRLLGVDSEVEIVKRGYYPRGGGKVILRFHGSKLRNKIFSRDAAKNTNVISVVSNLPYHIIERQIKPIKAEFEKLNVKNVSYHAKYLGPDKAAGPGTSVLIYTQSETGVLCGGDSIGERGKPAEVVGIEALKKYLEWYRSKAALDIFMADMIIPYLFMARGYSMYTAPRMTLHMDSALYVANKITERGFKVENINDEVKIEIL